MFNSNPLIVVYFIRLYRVWNITFLWYYWSSLHQLTACIYSYTTNAFVYRSLIPANKDNRHEPCRIQWLFNRCNSGVPPFQFVPLEIVLMKKPDTRHWSKCMWTTMPYRLCQHALALSSVRSQEPTEMSNTIHQVVWCDGYAEPSTRHTMLFVAIG